MRISALNTSTAIVRQKDAANSLDNLDSTGKLYKATLEKIARKGGALQDDPVSEAFIYARSGIQKGKAIASSSVVLENADGSRFSIDTTSKTVNLVAKGKDIDLYVFTPKTADNGTPSAVKYSFDNNGVMKAANAVTDLTAEELSNAEVTTKRDLDNNNVVGAKLDKTLSSSGANSGKRTATGTASDAIFKVNVMDQDLFVVGSSNIEKLKNINAKVSGTTLKNADGSAPWSPIESFPDTEFTSFRAVNTKANDVSWTVYATADTGEVTRFQFDDEFKLKENEDSPYVLSNSDVVKAEVSSKRDLNADGIFGAKITAATDAAAGLYKAEVLGTTVYLSKTGATATDKTGGKPVSTEGSLLKSDGKAWDGPGASYQIASMVKTGVADADRTVYAYKFDNNVADKDTLVKFNFTSTGADKNFKLDADSVVGISVTADEFANAEKTAKRDLNKDGVFGVEIDTTPIDSEGGLYKGSILGKDFYIAGSGLRTGSSGSLALNLSGSLLNADDSAWKPGTGYTVASVVPVKNGANIVGYDAYATKVDKKDILKYSFEKIGNSTNWTVKPETKLGVKVTEKDLAIAEFDSTRDLNKDGDFGLSAELTVLDATGGLYKGKVLGSDYVLVGTNPSSNANGAIDLSTALLKADGSAWEQSDPTSTLRIFKELDDSYSVYETTDQGLAAATYTKYTFSDEYIQTGNAENLTAEEFAAAEKSAETDFNNDNKFGVNITDALDSRAGLYMGSLDAKEDVFFIGEPNLTPGSKVAAEALDFSSALKTSTGYWTPDTDFDITAGLETDGGDTFTVFAVNDTDNAIKKYVFDLTDNKNTLMGEESGDMKLSDLVAIETDAANKRDLNGDGLIGIKVTTTLDAIDGLFSVTAGEQTILSLGGANAARPTDLSKALLNADGSFWSATGVDRYTLIKDGNINKVYAEKSGDFTEYTFDANNKLDATKTRSTDDALDATGTATLSAIKLADIEIEGERDINGDNVLGAKITKTLVSDTLYEAKIGSETFTVMNTGSNGKTTGLVNAALLEADGSTKWEIDAGFEIKAAVVTAGASTEVYALNANNDGKRYTFASNGTLLKTDDVTAEQITKAGDVGSLIANEVDSDGGLFKATVLGADFYVVGANGAPTDLSQALLLDNTGSADAWNPNSGTAGTGFKIGGLVSNADSYDVYVYNTDAQGVVKDVFKSSWDANFSYQGTKRADPAALVAVETAEKRDLNKDGAFGFRVAKATGTDAAYQGVSIGKVGGSDATYILASKDIKPGTSIAPLGLDNALLNSAGNAAWKPDTGFKITGVSDSAVAGNRYVYAVKDGAAGKLDEFKRYEFVKATGKSLDAGVSVSALEIAELEINVAADDTDDQDLSGDGKIGAVSISDYRVLEGGNPTGRSTGLLKASLNDSEFFVVNTMPANGGKLDLSKALLKKDGADIVAWDKPANFDIKGIFENANDELEVYGTGADSKIKSIKFSKQVDANGNETGAYIQMNPIVGSTLPNDMNGFQVAQAEYDSEIDLNYDGTRGFKAANSPSVFESPTLAASQEFAYGEASVGGSTIYFVTTDFAAAKTNADGSAVKAGALKFDDGKENVYWNPNSAPDGTTYTVKSIVGKAADELEVWAESDDGTDKGLIKFSFANDGTDWVLDSSSYVDVDPLTLEQVIAEEAGGGLTPVDSAYTPTGDYVGRDLNGDGAIGLKLESAGTNSMSLSNVYKTSIGDEDYYLVGTNLSSGTEANPLKLDEGMVLMNGAAAWEADGDVTGWTSLNAQEAADNLATHKLTDDSGTVYFNYDGTTFSKV